MTTWRMAKTPLAKRLQTSIVIPRWACKLTHVLNPSSALISPGCAGLEGLVNSIVYILCGLMLSSQDMEEQFATEDVIDAEHGDEEEDVEMDFGEETGGSEGTSATEEDEEPDDPDDEEGDSEEDWHDEDEDEDLLEEDEENRAPEADGQVDPDVDVDGVWEVWRMMCLFPGQCFLHDGSLGRWYGGRCPGR